MTDTTIFKRIYQEVKPYRWSLAISMVCMVMVAGFSAAQAYMVKPLLDKIFFEKNQLILNILPLALVGIFLAKGFFYYTYSVLLEKVGQSVIRDLRRKIFTHIHSLPLSYFHKTPTGELISRLISDVTLIQSAVSSAMVSILKDSVQILGLLVVVFYQNWLLASISIIFLPMALVPIILIGKMHRRYSMENQQTTALISNNLHETIAGNRIVKAFCMEEYETKRFTGLINQLFSIILKDTKIRNFSHSFMELLGGIFVAWIIWYGGREVLKGVATPGTFFSFLTALIMIYEPIKGISRMNSTIQQGLASANRVYAVLDIKPDIADYPNATDIPSLSQSIEFKDVSFHYDNNVPVLKGINLTVRAGEVVAIAGPSGGGKTTLVNMIPRFFEATGGTILIDGHDIRTVTIKSLRSQIAIVTQETILFNDSIRNNIAYGDPNRSDEEIMAAAQAAHAYEFIMELPNGVDTLIGESGAKLSGGQRQRLSIARALLKNAPILILDEATSALDTESEREVQKALENLMKNRTTFVIAHRLSTIRNADRIIVVQDGRIVEEGRHEELLDRPEGVYKTLYNLQH
ncbi:MAG: lipid A export permease/ATP-binding protein MsbA [Deltaproteobacteria bacterium RIFOXYD12_FULL_50_9]|nr:MAG: lipid A export permease/ATP-binding protein MsbA [Deltaproteobacteria bacterium RIFOXYD12_FULL_50_9]